MAIEIIERATSREQSVGFERPQAELTYLVTGTEDEAAVKLQVENRAPAFYGGMPFQNYSISPLGAGVWEATVNYGVREPKELNGSSFSFDTGGGTTHITQSLETVAKYGGAGGVAPDCKGAIGVTKDSVDGTDITVPVYSFTETHHIPVANVTNAYKTALFLLTGKTNSATFRGFAAGEVLFLGASGSQRGFEDWEITFRFAASPNVTGLSVGDITGIAKEGWQYLWVKYADTESDGAIVKQPVAVYVEKVYESGDYSALGIGA